MPVVPTPQLTTQVDHKQQTKFLVIVNYFSVFVNSLTARGTESTKYKYKKK